MIVIELFGMLGRVGGFGVLGLLVEGLLKEGCLLIEVLLKEGFVLSLIFLGFGGLMIGLGGGGGGGLRISFC